MASNIQKTFFIIKPEAFSKRKKIKYFIESTSQLKVVDSMEIILDARDVRTLFIDDKRSSLMRAIMLHLVGKKVEIGIVEGENSVNTFIELCGTNPDNRLCKENSIRKVFGKERSAIYEGTTYFLNAIHKASAEEAEISVDWFYKKKRSQPVSIMTS